MNSSDGGPSFNSAISTPNLENLLLLQSLMSRLQLWPPNLQMLPPFPAAKSLEYLLLSDILLNLSESDSDSDFSSSKTQLAKEESKLEKHIVRTILAGEIEKLKPNSSQAITVEEHNICVGCQEESRFDYRLWEWHGHIMLFDEANRYSPEYIYGNYFERVGATKKKMKNDVVNKSNGGDDDEKETKIEKVGNVGSKEMVECGESASGQILHQNINAGLTRFLLKTNSLSWIFNKLNLLEINGGILMQFGVLLIKFVQYAALKTGLDVTLLACYCLVFMLQHISMEIVE